MTLDNQRLLQYVLYGLGLILWFVLWKFLGSMIELVTVGFSLRPVDVPVFGSLANLSAIFALGAAVAGAEYARRNPVSNKFGIEVLSELRKVSWPNWTEVKGTTMVVLGVSIVVSLILFVFDKIYEQLIRLIY
jgi:preprotein translocase SecE subunit